MEQHERPDAPSPALGDQETGEAPPGQLTPVRQTDLREEIDEPARLLRIASAVQAMLHEVQTTELDEAARQRLTDIHNRAVEDLRELVSEDLRRELEQLTFEPAEETPTGAELRVMQAQLAGWLQGLFHGIQASIATQQLAAQQQPARMRGQPEAEGPVPGRPGQYL